MEGKSGSTVNLNFTGKDTNLRARNGAGYLLKNLVLSEGTIIIGQAAPENLSDSLTINGSYVAKDGNLYLNGQLGADNSPFNTLTINGVAKGNTNVSVINVGGKGTFAF